MIKKLILNWSIGKRRVTHVEQKINNDPIVMSDFINMVNEVVNCLKIPLEKVMNVDQTNLKFDMNIPYTFEFIGTRSVDVRTTSNAHRSSIFLCLNAFSTKGINSKGTTFNSG